MNSGIVVLMKHVEKNDLPVLADALGIPPVFRWGIFTRLGPLTGPLTVVTIFFFFFCVQCITKQFLDSVFAISRIMKVSVRVISPSFYLACTGFAFGVYGSVNSKPAHPSPPPGHLSSCRSRRWAFVRKPLPGDGTLSILLERG